MQLMFWNKRQVDFFFSVAVVSENDCNFNKPLKRHLTASELLQGQMTDATGWQRLRATQAGCCLLYPDSLVP